jgi:hypothetical protein
VGRTYTVQEVIERAIQASTFYTALMNVATSHNGRSVSNVLLGRWLKRIEGKIANGLALVQDGNRSGYPLWKLRR